MAIWSEPGMITTTFNSVARSISSEKRIDYSTPLSTWGVAESIEKDSFLTDDSPIIVDILLHSKWGL